MTTDKNAQIAPEAITAQLAVWEAAVEVAEVALERQLEHINEHKRAGFYLKGDPKINAYQQAKAALAEKEQR